MLFRRGYDVEGKDNVVYGTENDVCYTCEKKERAKEENRDKDRLEIHNMVKGRCAGQMMKRIPTLKDYDGVPVLICHDCLKEFAAETEMSDES